MAASLLEIVNFDNTVKRARTGDTDPLLMEFEVNPELAPFLVSSTRSVQWVTRASQSNMVRAAVRKRQQLEVEVVTAVADMGREAQWGNVHDLTTAGVGACVAHLHGYGIEPVEILVAPDTDLQGIEMPADVPTRPAEWMPREVLVAVPADRTFLGTMGTIRRHKAVAIVHNASRGMAVAWR